jgi:hypothetical protein
LPETIEFYRENIDFYKDFLIWFKLVTYLPIS